MLPLHHSEDQLTAGIRTQSLFFTERLFKFAEKNLTVKITGYIFNDFCSTIELPYGWDSNPQPKVWNVNVAVSILRIGGEHF